MNNSKFAKAFFYELEQIKTGWSIEKDHLNGPDNVRINFLNLHSSESDGHTDIEFVFYDNLGEQIKLIDCVSGFGKSKDDMTKTAAKIWANTSAPAMFEIKYSLKGEYADHYHSNAEFGFTGWHCICGNIMGYGQGESPQILQDWWINNPILPSIAKSMHDIHETISIPIGLKIFFGGNDVAEVRVNGEIFGRASRALLDLPWPRLKQVGFVRSYVILLHKEK